MDEIVWEQLQLRLHYEGQMNRTAQLFVELMTEGPIDLPESGGQIKIERRGDFDFLLLAHQREILAHYSVFFPKGENTVGGRYRFLLLPDRAVRLDGESDLIFEVELSRSGDMDFDGDRLPVDPASYQRAQVRKIIAMHLIRKAQQVLI